MQTTPADAEVQAINNLEAVRTILRVLSRATGLRVALVTRITNGAWTACAVLDEADFGVLPGGHLPLHTTY